MKPYQSPYKVHVHVEFEAFANIWCNTHLDNDDWLCYDYTSEYYHTFLLATKEEALKLAESIKKIHKDYVIIET